MELIICVLIISLYLLWHNSNKYKEKSQDEKNTYFSQSELQKKQIATLTRELDDAKSQISKHLQEITRLQKELDEAKRGLEFYKNIKEASGNLNVNDSVDKQTELLDQAVQQVKKVRDNTIQTPESSPHIAPDDQSLLDSEQFSACERMEKTGQNFFITGKAGTGKSFLLNVFRQTTKKKHIVLAPTGIASLNVNGFTLHSTFGYFNLVNLDVDMITDENIRLKSEKKFALRTVSTIIIDEISMVRADTFDKIDRILRVVNNNNLPFGGKQVLLFGDLFQLPPVAKSKEYDYLIDRYNGIYFFCSNAYKNGNFQFLELTINHRQKDDAVFFDLLNRIRDGSTSAKDISILNSRVVSDTSIYDRFTCLLPTKAEVEAVNRYHIEQLDSVGYKYPAQVLLDKYPNSNRKLDAILPITDVLHLKKGALVMMVANDPSRRWVNGTLGIVNELSNNKISVAIDKQIYDIEPFDFSEQEITYQNGRITYEDTLVVRQYPLVLAYAITIHKSQGQTYQNIVCDIGRCFANGQAYVALSRCASLNGLHLKKQITQAGIHVDRQVLEFYHEQSRSNKISILPMEN